jgi:flagellar protein FliO/FliZ
MIDVLLIAQTDVVGAAGPDFVPPIGRMFAGLLVVLGLLAVLGWALRRGLLARRSIGALGVETALALGERRSIVIVTVEGRRLLLGLAPGQVSLLTELGPAPFERALARAGAAGAEVPS